jgi:hypothetical protein
MMTPDISQTGKQNLEILAAIQKQFVHALTKVNQDWIDCANQEAKLSSNLAQKVTTAKSIQEATAAYQEWTSQQIELISSQARKVLEETQDFTKACAEIVGKSKWLADS